MNSFSEVATGFPAKSRELDPQSGFFPHTHLVADSGRAGLRDGEPVAPEHATKVSAG
jgi:hypothetical protein